MRVQEWYAVHNTREEAIAAAKDLVSWLGECNTRPVILGRPRHYVVQLWTFTDGEIRKYRQLKEMRYFKEEEIKGMLKIDGRKKQAR